MLEAVNSEIDTDTQSKVPSLTVLTRKMKNNFVPKLENGETGEYNEGDFVTYREEAKNFLRLINRFLSNTESANIFNAKTTKVQDFIVNCLLICGEHTEFNFWSDANTVQLSNVIVNKICAGLNCTITQLFVNTTVSENTATENKLGIVLLQMLRPKLLRGTWKQYPAAIACYKWITKNIQIPFMYEYMHIVFPTSLNLLDDYLVSNKGLGLQCLTHILHNLTPEQVKHYCSVDLFYNTVKSLLYWREERIVIPLVQCILEIVQKGDSKHWKQSADLDWSEYLDEMMNILLPIIEFEQNSNLQVKYIEVLYLIMQHSKTKISIARWSQRLIHVAERYSVSSQTSFQAMQVLDLFLTKCYPIMGRYSRQIALITGKVIHNCDDFGTYKLACRCYSIVYEELQNQICLPTLDQIKEKRKDKEEMD